jgi:hypothetical protein
MFVWWTIFWWRVATSLVLPNVDLSSARFGLTDALAGGICPCGGVYTLLLAILNVLLLLEQSMAVYKNRPPMDPATELRRYTSLNALERMLRDKRLRLTRIDQFEDPFEGSVPKQQTDDQVAIFSSANQMDMMAESQGGMHRHRSYIRDAWTRMTIRRRAATRSAHASSWTWGPESEAMWRLYCKDESVRGQGVALHTMLGKLESSITRADLYVSPIRYRLYHEGPAFNDEVDPFMHKRLGFECEREVRVLSYDQKHWQVLTWALIGGTGFEPTPPVPPPEMPEHIFIDWDPLAITRAIVISPYASEAYEKSVKAVVSAIDPAAIVELSLLSERRCGANF